MTKPLPESTCHVLKSFQLPVCLLRYLRDAGAAVVKPFVCVNAAESGEPVAVLATVEQPSCGHG